MEITRLEVGNVGRAVLKSSGFNQYKMNGMEGVGSEVDKFRLGYDPVTCVLNLVIELRSL
jgi:hypothetical protein